MLNILGATNNIFIREWITYWKPCFWIVVWKEIGIWLFSDWTWSECHQDCCRDPLCKSFDYVPSIPVKKCHLHYVTKVFPSICFSLPPIEHLMQGWSWGWLERRPWRWWRSMSIPIRPHWETWVLEIEQAFKLGRCDSYLQSETINHWHTHWLLHLKMLFLHYPISYFVQFWCKVFFCLLNVKSLSQLFKEGLQWKVWLIVTQGVNLCNNVVIKFV